MSTTNNYILTGKPFSPGSPLGPGAPYGDIVTERSLVKNFNERSAAVFFHFQSVVGQLCVVLLPNIVYNNLTSYDMC